MEIFLRRFKWFSFALHRLPLENEIWQTFRKIYCFPVMRRTELERKYSTNRFSQVQISVRNINVRNTNPYMVQYLVAHIANKASCCGFLHNWEPWKFIHIIRYPKGSSNTANSFKQMTRSVSLKDNKTWPSYRE